VEPFPAAICPACQIARETGATSAFNILASREKLFTPQFAPAEHH
jgi:hypothetical protein